MCQTEASSSSSSCAASSCTGSCSRQLATAEALQAAVATLQTANGAADDPLASLSPDVRAAVALLVENTELSLKLRMAKGTRAAQPVSMFVRRMKRRADDGPISGEAVATRMMDICGCKGQYDCDCVSVENMARAELWYRHNAGVEDPDRFERRRHS